jgi:hypothetical protein
MHEFEARIASAPLPSWREIDLAYGFHETLQGRRFTISPEPAPTSWTSSWPSTTTVTSRN